MDLPIEVDREQIAGFCRKHHLIKLALFGSVLTDRFGPDSDVDVLFEYD
ncbi:MAG TPA: nucleotidyltransferase domain-containing protein, partial [Candidatus Hydrogenedentes bacterium]|nr:nucleotidyltransferase domain-containing protein [Candidatus Hydrogenedentota bacterium]